MTFYTRLFGIHPCEVKDSFEEIDKDILEIEALAHAKKVVAIGEIGLDYYWEKEKKENQRYAFIKQTELANEIYSPASSPALTKSGFS